MTLEEAIVHCKEVAERQEQRAKDMREHRDEQVFDSYIAEATEVHCLECAADHRQLAEWLTELKEAKRLLKAAVEDINFYVDCFESHCDECCCDHDNHCHWKHEVEALALIGEDTNVPASADDTNVGGKGGGNE